MKKLFGTDGVRGIAYEFLTAELAEKVGAALGKILTEENGSPRVVIGGDTRESCGMLLEALSCGLCKTGATVHVAGTVPTPAIAYFTAELGFDAGVMISASHNTYEYNGIKIFGKGGFKLSDEAEERIEKMIDGGQLSPSGRQRGEVIEDPALRGAYTEHLKGFAPREPLGIRAVIDCANGSAYATAREVFSFLGDGTVFLGVSPDGRNINDGCGSTHLSLLTRAVTELGADIGIAFDGDADRFLGIDERGNKIDGDHVLAMLAESFREKNKLRMQTIIGTVMTNYGFCEFCRENGYTFSATKVGDRYVLEEMERGSFSLGGEQSGHTVIREAATTGDGQLTALYVLSRMAETGKPLSELASVMHSYPQYTKNISITAAYREKLNTDTRIGEIIRISEARLCGSGRILIRPSGTEPVVRIMVESRDGAVARSICEWAALELERILCE